MDGTFPMLSTDSAIPAAEALKLYKSQPNLEKRFSQFKNVHNAAPLFFKKIERVESIMFLFFLSLMVQSLIEREVRLGMKEHHIESLPIYPEDRNSESPTTSKILDYFDDFSIYKIRSNGKVVKEFIDELGPSHKKILELMEIKEKKLLESLVICHIKLIQKSSIFFVRKKSCMGCISLF